MARPSRSWFDSDGAFHDISRNALASGSQPFDKPAGAASVDFPDLLSLSPDELAHLEALGLIELETIEGTPIHPIWSEDRQDWVPLSELQRGETLRGQDGSANYPHSSETLQGRDGPATVLSVTLHAAAQPVYNIEVHGQHVYQVGLLEKEQKGQEFL